MPERPYSRYTRAKTWAALYSQYINAGYALVPVSRTNNSIDVINCKDAHKSPQDTARDTQRTAQELLQSANAIADYYRDYYRLRRLLEQDQEQMPGQELPEPPKPPKILADAINAKKFRSAVVLARSSDYYHYHLEDIPEFNLVICGLHDSYLHIPVWEMCTNKRYSARETAIALTSPDFDRLRRTQFGHNILIGALIAGNKDALAFIDRKGFPERTRRRLKQKAKFLQEKRYRGRPLAFLTDAERHEIGSKISEGLRRYYEQKKAI